MPQYRAYQIEIDAAIRRVLLSGVYVLGPEVDAFEREISAYVGVRHTVGVASGTDGLILALKALDVGAGDEVITVPFTAIPTISAIIATGATPVFVDVDPESCLIDVDRVARAVTPRTKAVMPVHLFGNVVDVPRLREVVGTRIRIVEDAAQAHGSTLWGRKAGSMGDAGVFSFYPTKNLGGYGDGGAVMTDDPEIETRLRLLRMYGMVDKDRTIAHGVNSRLDELQAAILRVKLGHLDEMNSCRRAIARRYLELLPAGRFKHQAYAEGVAGNHHVFVTRYLGARDQLVSDLDRQGIQANIYYRLPAHLQAANASLGCRRGDFPNAERLCDEVIALPMYPELPEEHLNRIISVIAAREEALT